MDLIVMLLLFKQLILPLPERHHVIQLECDPNLILLVPLILILGELNHGHLCAIHLPLTQLFNPCEPSWQLVEPRCHFILESVNDAALPQIGLQVL